MKYEVTIYKYDREKRESVPTDKVVVYEQPWVYHRLYQALSKVDLWFWRHKPTRRVLEVMDHLEERLHHRRCNNDCMTGTIGHRDRGSHDWVTKENQVYCGHMPLSIKVDLKLYRLSAYRETRVE